MKKNHLLLAVSAAAIIFSLSPAFAEQAKKEVYTRTTTQTHIKKPVVYNVKYKDMMTAEERAILQTDIEFNLRKLDVDLSKALERNEFVDKRAVNGITMAEANTEFMELDTDKSGYINSQEIMNSKMRQKAAEILQAMVATTPVVTKTVEETSVTDDGHGHVYKETKITN